MRERERENQTKPNEIGSGESVSKEGGDWVEVWGAPLLVIPWLTRGRSPATARPTGGPIQDPSVRAREARRGRGGEGEEGRERGRGLTFEEVAHAGIVVDGVRDRHDHLDDFLGDRVVGGGLPSENDHPWHDLLDHSAREVSAASVRAFYA